MAHLKGRELREKLTSLIEPLLSREGFELVEIEVLGAGPGTIVRIFIDKPGGVTLDDCASISEAVSAMLDVEDPIASAYHLEVSSPGLDRPLRKPEDYDRFVGQEAKIKTFGPVDGAGNRKMFVGKLTGRDGETVRINVDGTEYGVPMNAIAKAHLVWHGEEG
jgi:ribosome maturation factor RimP